MEKEVKVKSDVVSLAYENYLRYKNGNMHDELHHYLNFKKLLSFDSNFLGSEEFGRRMDGWTRHSDYFYMTEQMAHRLRLLATDYYKTLYRVLELRAEEENEAHADKWK